jgi:hypothetical protein
MGQRTKESEAGLRYTKIMRRNHTMYAFIAFPTGFSKIALNFIRNKTVYKIEAAQKKRTRH